ncbi:hypothetical protein [Arthrobacter sedimenti]|uniref:hypothetical protein n=1 Tax=Arthrobacter sedimenti TaxID=2694931 RepID=UPI001CDC33AE|nr:hypothetical protein [Arthrobacter sedimenti]
MTPQARRRDDGGAAGAGGFVHVSGEKCVSQGNTPTDRTIGWQKPCMTPQARRRDDGGAAVVPGVDTGECVSAHDAPLVRGSSDKNRERRRPDESRCAPHPPRRRRHDDGGRLQQEGAQCPTTRTSPWDNWPPAAA